MLEKYCNWSPERMQKEMMSSERRARTITNTVAQPRINEFFHTTRQKSFSPIVEPCVSIDDYIDAHNAWMKKRKRSGDAPKSSATPVKKRSANICLPHKPNHGGLITLDDSD